MAKDDPIIEAKHKLRHQMIAQREELSHEERNQAARMVCQWITEHAAFKRGRTILFYMPFRGEMDVRPAMEAAWKRDKCVVLPRAEPHSKSMTFWRIDHFLQLETGAYGIQEPLEREEARIEADELDLIIVPGVAFDPKGYRLGYGGGYYDRFFANNKKAFRLGVGYPFQLVSTVYPEKHDQPLHGLITSEQKIVFR